MDKTSGIKEYLKDRFDLHDAAVYLWFLAAEPVLALFLPGIDLYDISESRAWLFTALSMNYVNIFLMLVLVQKGYIEKGLSSFSRKGFAGAVSVFLHPAVMLTVNVCLTVTAAAGLCASAGYSSALFITLLISVLITLPILFGAWLSNTLNFTANPGSPAFRSMELVKDFLSWPLIIAGADLSSAVIFTMRGDGDALSLALTVFIAAPLCYFFLIFLLRATVALTVPSGRWIFRFALYLAAVITGNSILEFIAHAV